MAYTVAVGDAAQVHAQGLRQYLQRVTQALSSEDLLEDADGKEVFVNNVLEEIKGQEYRLSCDMHCSGAIEKLVHAADAKQLALLLHRLYDHREDLLTSRCGSHVVQAMVERMPALMSAGDPTAKDKGKEHGKKEEEKEEERVPALSQQLLDLANLFTSNLTAFLVDTYASHVLRALLCVLGGLPLKSVAGTVRSRSSQSYRHTFVEGETEGGGAGGAKGPVVAKAILTSAFPVLGNMAQSMLSLVRWKEMLPVRAFI